MKTMIVYDSLYGNTEKIAMAIGESLDQEDLTILRVGNVKPDQLAGVKLLIVGSPTQRFRPTPTISNFLKSIPRNSLNGVKVAAFDTRLTEGEINQTPILGFFVRLLGPKAFAARFLAKQIKKKGGKLIGSQEGFYVEGMKGPLVQGELERAAKWAKQIILVLPSSGSELTG